MNRNSNNNRANNHIEITDNSSSITPKIYQDIYHQITGRTEKISKTYDDNLLISFEEVKQLHFKILQLKDIHNVIAQNESISVFYAGERKDVFTSFERYEKYNSSNSKPTVSLLFKYNFSLLLAGTSAPQEYVITIKLLSRLSALEDLEENKSRYIPQRLMSFLTANTAEIDVEYVDYLVAKTYLQLFNEWLEGCPSNPNFKFIAWVQKHSHYIPRIVQLIIVLISLKYYDEYISTLPSSFNHEWGRFFLYSLISFFILVRLALIIGVKIERYVDSLQPLSYLELNNGDKNLVSKATTFRNKTYSKIFFQIILTIILGVISSKISLLF